MAIRGDEFDDLFARTRAAAEQLRGRVGGPAADAPEPAVGEAADGQVRVTLRADGTLEHIDVEPRLLREGLAHVCTQIVAAANSAIGEFRGRATAAGGVDVEALTATLRDVQADSLRRMAAFGTAVDDVVQRLIRSGGGAEQ